MAFIKNRSIKRQRVTCRDACVRAKTESHSGIEYEVVFRQMQIFVKQRHLCA